MPGDRVAWTRRNPKRAAGRLGWTAFVALMVWGAASLFFAGEPSEAANGAVNPLALVVPTLALLFVCILVPQVLALVRRPIVAADHYALTVRPGVGRTLVLPWPRVAELAAMEVDEEPYLLVRCVPSRRGIGDTPRWFDQGYLRSAKRAEPAVSPYDLAVPMNEFLGTAEELLADLARAAADHVVLVDDVT